jgi:hypothetical protein
MPLVNALLVTWADAEDWFTDPVSIDQWGRREDFLFKGDALSRAEAERIANATLAQLAQPRTARTAVIRPQGSGDEPYDDWPVGGSVDIVDGGTETVPVPALTVSGTREGGVLFAPELSTLRDERRRQADRWLKRMVNGTIGGTVESASPAAGFGAGPQARTQTDPLNLDGQTTEDTTALGVGSYREMQGGTGMVVIGQGSGNNIVAPADSNTLMGDFVGRHLEGGSFNVLIGDGADVDGGQENVDGAIGIGACLVKGDWGVQIGDGSSSEEEGVAVGRNAVAGVRGIAVGKGVAAGDDEVFLGHVKFGHVTGGFWDVEIDGVPYTIAVV